MNSYFTPEVLQQAERYFRGPIHFSAGATLPEQLPAALLPEVAFAGRSNVGKSSLINALTGHSHLARISATPGATRQINFFTLRESFILVDLPGYGYAKVQDKAIRQWTHLIRSYLKGRQTLRRVCLLIDARRGIKEADTAWMHLLDEAAVVYNILLTKADTLRENDIVRVQDSIKTLTGKHPALHPHCIAISSRKNQGIAELRAELYALVT